VPDPDRRTPTDKSGSQGDLDGALHIQSFGDEVHLSFEQRVPWGVALEILRVLKVEEVGRRETPPGNGHRTG
jgi:hypothetical protein